MKKLCIPFLFILLFSAAIAQAQSDTDTDPNRWDKVKSWQGTFTFTSKDSIRRPQGDTVLTSETDINFDGSFTLDERVTEASGSTGWHGKGIATGSVFWEMDIQSKDGTCTTIQNADQSLAPLVGTPGYRFEWFHTGANNGKYFFTTGEIRVPSTITSSCNGVAAPPVKQDWVLGGASSAGFRTLPASGYHIVADAEVNNFNGYNNGWVHWDLQPAEFQQATPSCPFQTALHDQARLNIVRAARDSIASTPPGIELVYLYYANVSEITGIIVSDADLRNKLRGLIINNIQNAQELAARGEAAIDCEIMQDIVSFLQELQSKGSPRLKKAVERVLQIVEDTDVLYSLGVRVTQ